METAKGKAREEAITKLAERIDSFEKYSYPHSRMIAELATHLARRFGLAPSDVHAIAEAAFLHDIGLHAMAPAYHATSGPLSFEERMDLWRHTVIGEQQMAKRDGMRHAQLLVRWHHEWWNGTGYPDGLAFEDIPIGARILRAVELYSALIADRPYRTALNSDQAMETLKAAAGIECDPYVVKALVSLLDDMRAYIEQTEAQAAAYVPVAEASPVTTPLASPNDLSPAAQSESSIASLPSPETDATIDRPSPLDKHAPVVDAPARVSSDWQATGLAPDAANEPHAAVLDMADESSHALPFDSAIQSPSASLAAPPSRDPHAPPPVEPEAMHAAPPVEITPPVEASVVAEETTARHLPSSHEIEAAHESSSLHAIEPEQPGEPTLATDPASRDAFASPSETPVTARQDAPRVVEPLRSRPRAAEFVDQQVGQWPGWSGSHYNRKALLGFEASVLRQQEFRSIAIPYYGWTRLDLYLKTWGKHILANDPRAWAATVARAMVEARVPLHEEQIMRVLEDVYVPGAKMANPALCNWFSEIDAWWMDNLRRNIEALDDETLRAQALVLGMMTGDYALSFDDATRELKKPLTTVFWRLAGRATAGPAGNTYNRSAHQPVEEFLKRARADLLYLNLPAPHVMAAGAEARGDWREAWVSSSAQTGDPKTQASALQSKHAYLATIDKLLQAAAAFRTWAIGYQEIGMASAAEISELIKAHRPVHATYSKDLTEVSGGLRSYIIIAQSTTAS